MTDVAPQQRPRPSHEPLAAPKRTRRRRIVMIVMFAAVFLFGVVTGGALSAAFVMHRFHLRSKQPHMIPQRIAYRMQRKLGLTDRQTQQVLAILTHRLGVLMEIHHQVNPLIEAEMKLAEDEVAAVLSPDQAHQWRQWCAYRFHKRWRRSPSSGSGPGPPVNDRWIEP